MRWIKDVYSLCLHLLYCLALLLSFVKRLRGKKCRRVCVPICMRMLGGSVVRPSFLSALEPPDEWSYRPPPATGADLWFYPSASEVIRHTCAIQIRLLLLLLFTRAGVQSIWNGHRRSNVEGVGSGEGLCPLPRKFLYFLYQNGDLLCILGDIYWHCFFKKGTLNKRAGVRTPWTPPGSAPVQLTKHEREIKIHHFLEVRDVQWLWWWWWWSGKWMFKVILSVQRPLI